MNKRHLFATLFLLLLTMSLHVNAGEIEPATGLEGVIVISPASAGPTMAGGPDSAPLANVEFNVKKGDEVVASFTTDEQGRFRVFLTPGHYVVSLKSGKRRMGRYGPFEVDVIAGQIKRVQWSCDSGLR